MSEITKNLHHEDHEESDEELGDTEQPISKKETVPLGSPSGVLGMIDTFDREGDATAEGLYAKNETYAVSFKNEPGQRIPKAGYVAEAGVGRARAEYSVFHAEARGPNAGFKAEASWLGAGAMARAEIASASANAGPLGVKVGLGLDTGASFGVDGVEAKILGTGISIGPKISVAVLGSEASLSLCSVM